LQKKPINLSILLTEATPYSQCNRLYARCHAALTHTLTYIHMYKRAYISTEKRPRTRTHNYTLTHTHTHTHTRYYIQKSLHMHTKETTHTHTQSHTNKREYIRKRPRTHTRIHIYTIIQTRLPYIYKSDYAQTHKNIHICTDVHMYKRA